MAQEILKSNGKFVSRNTVCALNEEEEHSEALLNARRQFMEELEVAMGPGCQDQDFEPDDLTPEFELYSDASQNDDGLQGTPDEELPPTLEVGDNYVGACLLLPGGGDHDMAQGKVVKCARRQDGNPIGRANDNLILDTREYVVQFEDGTEAELSANTIAQNMYAQCDPDGNCYVLFDSIVDYRRSTTDLCYEDQIARKADGRTFMRRSTAG